MRRNKSRRKANRTKKIARSLGMVAATSMLATGVLMVAQADDQQPVFKKRVYIGAGVGATKLEPKPKDSSISVAEDSDTGFHATVGFDFNSRLSAEAYFADLGSAGISFLGADVGDIDYQVFGVSAIGYLYNSQSGFNGSSTGGLSQRNGLSLYARAGVGSVKAESKLDFKVNHDAHLALGIGAEYGFRNGFAVRAEYTAMDSDMHYASLGVIKRFGKAASAIPVAAVAAPIVADSADAPAPKKQTRAITSLPFPTVNFDFDKSNINSTAAAKLDGIVEVLLESETKVTLAGHTDWIASRDYNYALSLRRAESVRRYLEDKGIGRDRMLVRAYGEDRPVANNETDEGRAANRRVDIQIQN